MVISQVLTKSQKYAIYSLNDTQHYYTFTIVKKVIKSFTTNSCKSKCTNEGELKWTDIQKGLCWPL